MQPVWVSLLRHLFSSLGEENLKRATRDIGFATKLGAPRFVMEEIAQNLGFASDFIHDLFPRSAYSNSHEMYHELARIHNWFLVPRLRNRKVGFDLAEDLAIALGSPSSAVTSPSSAVASPLDSGLCCLIDTLSSVYEQDAV